MNKIKIILLALFLVQLAVPLSMIVQKEMILERGEIVKFQVRPVDPYDAFRGRYLSIGLMEDKVDSGGLTFNEGEKAYVLLARDSDGFAYFLGISRVPYKDELYLECTVSYQYNGEVTIEPSFDRYYLNEDYSQMGEELYNRFSLGEREDAYVTVRISKGRAVLEDMYLAGVEINELIEEELKK